MPPPGVAARWPFWLVLLPSLALAQAAFKHVDHKHWTDQYDHHFKKYSKHYFGPGMDWRWFKAQAIAESGLDPNARSDAGAKGIMQIMPATFKDIKEKNPHFTAPSDPKWNIAAGIYYDRMLYLRWDDYIGPSERLPFAFGSYNAGFGNVRKAYREARKKKKPVKRWADVEALVPGQTRHYVRRIQRLMKRRN